MGQEAKRGHLATLRDAIERAADEPDGLPPDAGLRFRAMFGGMGAYAHDRMFASLSNVGLGLKLAAPDRAELLRLEGARPLQYEPDGPVSREYVVVPAAVVAEPGRLAPWLRRSVEHTVRAAAGTRRRRAAPA